MTFLGGGGGGGVHVVGAWVGRSAVANELALKNKHPLVPFTVQTR